MRMRTMLAVLSVLGSAACSSSTTDSGGALLGDFGGNGVALHATARATSITLPCDGTIALPSGVTIDADGRFSFSANLHALYPSNRDTLPYVPNTDIVYSVNVSGQVTGDALTLHVAVVSGTTTLWSLDYAANRGAVSGLNGVCRL